MHPLSLFIFGVASNIVAILFADYFIPGFVASKELVQLLMAGGIFALLNILIRPMLKLVLGPVIFLTFGLGIILVNGLIIMALDFLTDSITIESTLSLLYATLIISAVSLIVHLSAKSLFNK
ncbi:MAG: phage holin family protein [Candidatus Liptonbacteria bacterium]|nr:phage holin family protein [Candidatus Liptonbacteria bacterium]